MLKVSNIRLGFANNSSSSHSILLCNAIEHGEVDKMTNGELGDEEPFFGWEGFVCASPEAKARYFACQLAATMSQEVGEEITSLTVAALLGVPEKFGKGTVDHQSQIVLPYYSDGTLAISFIRELFLDAINNPRLVIGGGNDNNDHEPLTAQGQPSEWFSALGNDYNGKDLVARAESYGWCLFNKYTGARIRLQRDGAKSDLPETPELVDVCITKYCTKGCKFCYQDCGYKGEHASKEWLGQLAYILQNNKVFEVVLGGGEPTQHPDFLYILDTFKKHNIIPNFTTANSNWLRDKKFVADVVKSVGSIAFSCHDVYDVEHFGKLILLAGEELAKKAVLQSIVGIVAPEELEKMLAITESFGFYKYSLVGFKQTGRAPKEIPYPIEQYNLLETVKGSRLRFYADTALLNLCPEIVEEYTCDVAEGKQSMYIDAVNKTMHESSYTGDSIEFKDKRYPYYSDIMPAFHSFQKNK